MIKLTFSLTIVILLMVILFNLFRALLQLVNPKPDKPPMAQLLGRRVLFSAGVLLLLVLAMALGLVEPNARPY